MDRFDVMRVATALPPKSAFRTLIPQLGDSLKAKQTKNGSCSEPIRLWIDVLFI